MAQKFTLDSFKDAMLENTELRENLSGTSDILNFDTGNAIIHRENLNKYLERYMCKDERDLEDTLWYSYGMYVKIV